MAFSPGLLIRLRPLVQVQPVTSGSAGHSAFRREPNQMHLGWDEVWIALTELSRNTRRSRLFAIPWLWACPR